jgi:hypothetical protein
MGSLARSRVVTNETERNRSQRNERIHVDTGFALFDRRDAIVAMDYRRNRVSFGAMRTLSRE